MLNEVKKLDREIKLFSILRIVNPIMMLCIMTTMLHAIAGLPLVLAISIASIVAVIIFTILSFVLQRKINAREVSE